MGIPVRLQTIKSFRKRGRRNGNSDFHDRTEFEVRITAASCVASFGFDRTLEIMMLVWLWLRSPPMLMRCNNEDKLPNCHTRAFFRQVESA
jgi:hypothetical protein